MLVLLCMVAYELMVMLCSGCLSVVQLVSVYNVSVFIRQYLCFFPVCMLSRTTTSGGGIVVVGRDIPG
jgi:hypothetical protein